MVCIHFTHKQRAKKKLPAKEQENEEMKAQQEVNFEYTQNLDEKVLEGDYYGAEEAREGAARYIRGVLNVGTEEDRSYAWDDGKDISHYFCAYGQMGKGKTRFHNELCRQAPNIHEDLEVRCVRVTYNENATLPMPGSDTVAFARNLLISHGCSIQASVGIDSLQKAVDIICSKVEYEECKRRVLVICVDDILQLVLKNVTAEEKFERIGSLVRDLCLFQDSTLNKDAEVAVLFLFNSVTKPMMDVERTAAEYFVPEIPATNALELLWQRRPDLQRRYPTDKVLQLLVHTCLPTPRALLEGIPAAYPEGIGTVSMDSAFQTIARVAQMNLKSIENSINDTTEYTWLTEGCLPDDQKEELFKCGLAIHNKSTKDLDLHPLVLRYWCSPPDNAPPVKEGTVRHYLREAYIADSMVQPHHEKDVEPLLYNFEAAKRIAYGSSRFNLSDYYEGGHLLGESSEDIEVSVFGENASHTQVCEVDSFAHNSVMTKLEEGCIVVSKNPIENGIEYLTPFFVDNNLKYVAAAQAKFSPKIKGSYKVIAAAAMKQPIIKHLELQGIICFPVIFSSSHGNLSYEAKKVEGVLFNEASLHELTSRLGPLRAHREKASEEMESEILVKAGLPPKHIHSWNNSEIGGPGGKEWDCPKCNRVRRPRQLIYSCTHKDCKEQRCALCKKEKFC